MDARPDDDDDDDAAAAALRAQTLGYAMMAAGMLLIPVGDAFGKLAAEGSTITGPAIAWTRFVLGFLIVAPIALRTRFDGWLTRRFLAAQLVRGALLSAAVGSILTGLSRAPLTEVYGAFFIGPLVSTALAALLLNERPSLLEWLALLAGVAGVLLVVGPIDSLSVGVAWGLVAGTFYGSFLVATRRSAAVAPPLVQLLGQLAVAAVVLAPLGAPALVVDGAEQALWLALSGVSSALANLLTISALALVFATRLAPLVYLQLISATALGWLVFGEALEAAAMGGMALIFLSGVVGAAYRAMTAARPRSGRSGREGP